MKKKKRRIYVGAILFWLLYFAGIGACCYGIHYGLGWLEGWLVEYEAAQPDVKSEQVFQERFANPDWQALYQEAGCTDTVFESAAHYEAYMLEKIGSSEITYYETSNGLSDDHKYVITAGGEKLATFLMRDMDPDDNKMDWQYLSCEVFFTREKSVWICTEQEVSVFINGVELDESYVMQTLHTDVEEYLPEGEHGLRRQWLYVDDLLNEPVITATDASGQAVELTYDEDTGMYTQSFAPMEITEEESSFAIEATKVYCRYMIGDGNGTLSRYFDRSMDNYTTILYGDAWMQEYRSYSFSEAELLSFYRYTDAHYSVRVRMNMNVKRGNGTIKEYPMDSTLFIRKQEDGSWIVYRMINIEVQGQVTMVRLSYMVDGELVESGLVENNTKTLTPPAVQAPEGQVFTGWYVLSADEQGNSTYSLAFLPEEDGTVALGVELEPMTLYALFEKET